MTNNLQPKKINSDYIDTDGGALIEGSVETKRDFINRDKADGDIVYGDKHVHLSSPQETPVPSEEPTPGDPPYMGLPFFEESDAHLFFGRDALTEELVQLVTEINQHDSRFLAIVGASGSGKSSLVRAGLIPALRQGKIQGSDRWPIHIVRPDADPLKSLAIGLTTEHTPHDIISDLIKAMEQAPSIIRYSSVKQTIGRFSTMQSLHIN